MIIAPVSLGTPALPMKKGGRAMASQEWMKQYEAQKEKLECKIDLEAYFTET